MICAYQNLLLIIVCLVNSCIMRFVILFKIRKLRKNLSNIKIDTSVSEAIMIQSYFFVLLEFKTVFKMSGFSLKSKFTLNAAL